MKKQGNKQDLIEAAIARSIDWKYVEKMDKVRHKITNYILDKKNPLGYRGMDEKSYLRDRTTAESYADRQEKFRIYGL